MQPKEKESVIKQLQQYPVEVVELPSKGLVYPESSPLAKGTVDIYYPDTSHEDILTSQNLIQKGVVIDKFLEKIIASDINYSELLLGDKDAIMIAARILAYGSDYETKTTCRYCGDKDQKPPFSLGQLKDKEIDFSLLNRNNVYEFELPTSKHTITFKLLKQSDEKEIENELKYQKDFNKKAGIKTDVPDKVLSTRLFKMILSINTPLGIIDDHKDIKQYKMLTRDSMAFRSHLNEITPGVDMTVDFECTECNQNNTITLPMGVEFFWPNV